MIGSNFTPVYNHGISHFIPPSNSQPTVKTRVGGTTSSSSGSSSGLKKGETSSSLFASAMKDALNAAKNMDAYMSNTYESAMERILPGWRDEIIGTARGAVRDVKHVTDQFKKVLPDLMKRTNDISVNALKQVNSMLQGEIPDDVAQQLKRNAAEISQQIGVRGQAAQNLTARDLGRTSLDLIQTGLQFAPSAVALAPDAYRRYQGVVAAPGDAAAGLGQLVRGMLPPMTDVPGLFTNMAGIAQRQSQFGTATANENYWNRFNVELGRDAINVSKGQLGAAQDYNKTMANLQREQLEWMKAAVTYQPGAVSGDTGQTDRLSAAVLHYPGASIGALN